MDESSERDRTVAGLRGAVVFLAGLGIVALPEPVAAGLGLLLLYSLAGVAIVSGVMNVVGALRVREIAGWLLPAGLLVLVLGLTTLAAPAALGSVLARSVGGVVALGGGLAILSAIRRGRQLRWADPRQRRRLQAR
ncbi:MAG TPA: DUF308 domain-containing protein [Candidatus Binatia bacterium]|nr:DUF308 domain-containing protein [Candidatus Binatia bacterium]